MASLGGGPSSTIHTVCTVGNGALAHLFVLKAPFALHCKPSEYSAGTRRTILRKREGWRSIDNPRRQPKENKGIKGCSTAVAALSENIFKLGAFYSVLQFYNFLSQLGPNNWKLLCANSVSRAYIIGVQQKM